jgi:hypothetical protein
MNQITHPIEPEELMAHLDGELSADREAVAIAHLSKCPECQEMVTHLSGVSKRLNDWNVQQKEQAMPAAIVDVLDKSAAAPRPVAARARGWRDGLHLRWRTVAWAGGLAAVAVLFYVGTVAFREEKITSFYEVESRAREGGTPPPAAALQSRQVDRLQEFSKLNKAPAVAGGIVSRHDSQSELYTYLESEQESGAGYLNREDKNVGNSAAGRGANLPSVAGPMIIRTAQLALITKDFDKARESVESILRRHRGYIGELKIGGSSGSGRTLTGTLRVPADQLDATIADLKPLGRVESESQSGQDVTSQYVDLQARLTNARNTEQRLTDLLRNRTGKLSDVLEVEQELDRVRGEIEQMEAERKNMSNQVSYATLNLTVSEDYKAQLQVVPPSTSTRLSNAAVEGYRSVVDGVLDVTLFVLTTGPGLLLWGVALFFPARFAWKKLRRSVAQ